MARYVPLSDNGNCRRELLGIIMWATGVMLLTCLPYVYALRIADGRTFGGFLWGVDEGNVYLTWMRQAAEGEIFFRNQYTTDPEKPLFFNLFLQLGGRLGKLLHLDMKTMFHLLRVGGGILLFFSFWLLLREIIIDGLARWAAIGLASIGSGWGWLIVLFFPSSGIHPVDVGQDWQTQPEAVTFLSLLLNGLFTASMALMCLTFFFTLRAIRDKDKRSILWAGLCLLILGNIHTYDVFAVWLTLAAGALGGIWGAGSRLKALGDIAKIIGIGLPSFLWAIYATFADPAFLAKGLTPTPAFRFVDYFVAYGFIGLAAGLSILYFLLAHVPRTMAAFFRKEEQENSGRKISLKILFSRNTGFVQSTIYVFPLLWTFAHILVLCTPVSFQRKMIEGLHLPLCILAGLAVAWLAQSLTEHLRRQGKHKQAHERAVLFVCGFIVLCLPSNALFVSQCMHNVQTNNADLWRVLQPPIYLEAADAKALEWLRENATRDDVILSTSLIGSYIPTYCRAKVWIGHWAETLHFRERLRAVPAIYGQIAPEQWKALLQQMRISIIYYGPYEQSLGWGTSGTDLAWAEYGQKWRRTAEKHFPKIYEQEGVWIYRVPVQGSRE